MSSSPIFGATTPDHGHQSHEEMGASHQLDRHSNVAAPSRHGRYVEASESMRLQEISAAPHQDDSVVPQRESSSEPSLNAARQRFEVLFDRIESENPSLIENYFGTRVETASCEKDRTGNGMGSFLLNVSKPGALRDSLDCAIVNDVEQGDDESRIAAQKNVSSFLAIEQRMDATYRLLGTRVPTQLWHCCRKMCFARISIDPLQFMVLDELLLIHSHAESCQLALEKAPLMMERRRHGIGTSTVAFEAPSREERELAAGGERGTERERALRELGKFVVEVLPFLYAQCDSPRGTQRLQQKLCTEAICCLLGVSRNFLYNRRCSPKSGCATDEELTSLIDSAGIRLRQKRRNGNRDGYPSLQSLQHYDCGCDVPCFAEVPQLSLSSEYTDFIKLASQLKPRHKENRFLLNRMFCPLTNSTISVCNNAVSALYTVSETLVADVRRILDRMCNDPSVADRPILTNSTLRYQYDRKHPMNRYPDAVRDKIENHLDMVLRADPAGSSGESVCRVYSPEINTQEKLRNLLREALGGDDDSIDAALSASTLQRMVQDYLKRRNYSCISFTQSDHNACPNCKTLQYAVLQFYHELAVMQPDLDDLSRRRPLPEEDQKRHDILSDDIKTKRFQEEECIQELKAHNSRDARIRHAVKKLSDYFRDVEREHVQMLYNQNHPESESRDVAHVEWNSYPNRASMTHQDDMSKLDLPHFVVSASSDITRWRFDVNAHVSSVTNNAVVLSHEQGTGAKNASSIIEEILINHVLQCRGEAIKIVVSDNAAVGKNWLTTIALPQYLVDQGLAEIVLVIFLENNHGKWLCDMLFGQFQSRRRREVLFSADDMLAGFEDVKRRFGKAEGFAVNPLSSVQFAEVFESLGYETKPLKDFGFTKRNIHFSGACVAGAKQRLPARLKKILEHALPDDSGMVRISTEPPGDIVQSQLRYEDRYFDVPAARLTNLAAEADVSAGLQHDDDSCVAPLVVPHDTPYSPNGNCVVSTRTAQHVGYNGLAFRGLAACPEMRINSSVLVRRAWPRGLLNPPVGGAESNEPVAGAESIKCAPLNWIVRRPVRHFARSEADWIARYPPRNLLNAKYRQPPREPNPWVPTATYSEPPFPIADGTAACSAMKRLADEHSDITQSLHVLDALKAIFREMGNRDRVSDPWLQRRVTQPSRNALDRYRYELRLYTERESGHPPAPKTLRQFFKQDENVLAETARILRNHSVSGQTARKLKTATLAKLFEEAENRPAGLDRFYHLVQKDQERYARDLKEFRKKQEQFDKDHGLSPVEQGVAHSQ